MNKNKIKFQFLFSFFVILSQCKWAEPFPNGAPVEHCGDMMPKHGVEPLPDESPFQITYQPNNSTGGFDVTISSMDSSKFKGFLLEARAKWDGQAIGKWTTEEAHTKTLDCFGSSQSGVTHHWKEDNLGDKKKGFTEVTFNWVPPVSKKLNRVKFIATVVQSYHKIYFNVSSQLKLKSFRKTNLI